MKQKYKTLLMMAFLSVFVAHCGSESDSSVEGVELKEFNPSESIEASDSATDGMNIFERLVENTNDNPDENIICSATNCYYFVDPCADNACEDEADDSENEENPCKTGEEGCLTAEELLGHPVTVVERY